MFYKNLTKVILVLSFQWFIISLFLKLGITVGSWWFVFIPFYILFVLFIVGYICKKIVEWHRNYLINRSYDVLLADNENERIKLHKQYIDLVEKNNEDKTKNK